MGRKPKVSVDEMGVAQDQTEETTEETEVKAPDASLSPFTQKLMESAQKNTGIKGVYIGTDRRIVGLEPYALALQYLMDLQVVPLQSIITLSGEPKTYKTSTMLEFCNMFLGLTPEPGVAAVAHTEGKWSSSKAASMLRGHSNQLIVLPATTIEEWQNSATSLLNTMEDVMAKKKEAIRSRTKSSQYTDMRIPPMVIGVDSLTGSQSAGIQENVIKEGHGAKTYQDRAMLIWQWLDTWGSRILGMPALVVLTQHLKDKIDSMGTGPQKITPGGTGAGFHTSMEIRMRKVAEIKKSDYEGATLDWTMHFNSLGRDKRRIQVDYIESYDEHDMQIAWFDWDSALIKLIMSLQEHVVLRDRVQAVTGDIVEYTKPAFGKVYSCEVLDINRAKALEDGIDATTLGRLLQAPGKLREDLRKALRIQPADVWTPDTIL